MRLNLKRLNKRQIISAVLLILVAVAVVVAVTYKREDRYVAPPDIKVSSTGNIKITEDGFVPETLKVKAGAAVLWTNVDVDAHRVAANPFPVKADEALDSKVNLSTGGVYRHTFTTPGTYQYHDEVNPEFNGTIVVE